MRLRLPDNRPRDGASEKPRFAALKVVKAELPTAIEVVVRRREEEKSKLRLERGDC